MVIEVNSVIESTPAIHDLSFYQGNYVNQDRNYKLEIRKDAQDNLIATLVISDSVKTVLKHPEVRDAYFTSTITNADGLEER
jgi:hypothetical protein